MLPRRGRKRKSRARVLWAAFVSSLVLFSGATIIGVYHITTRETRGSGDSGSVGVDDQGLRGSSNLPALPNLLNWAGPSAANRAVFSNGSAAHREFCSHIPPPSLTAAEAAWVEGHRMDLVNRWPLPRLEALEGSVTCHWASHFHPTLRLPPIPLCVHDPAEDTLISAAILRGGWWGGFEESAFMLGGGYAAGTPLNNANASAMRAAATIRAVSGQPPFPSTSAIVESLQLPQPDPLTKSACSRERPVVLDVGGNIGLFSDAFAASGCTVVVIEPLTINAGRFWQSMKRNRWTSHVWLYKNAVSLDRRIAILQYYTSIHGQSKVKGVFTAFFFSLHCVPRLRTGAGLSP
jgi:hypothetical protein